MIIPKDLLVKNKAHFIELKKDDFIFEEAEPASFYFQVISGTVKMSSYSENGQEFIQGIFKAGQSFGEPAVFGDFPYPNNAVATEDAEIAKLPKDVFFNLLKENFDIHKKFNALLSNRLRYKAILLKEISSYCPDHVIMTLLRYLRDNSTEADKAQFYVPYTRQQLADMTGLRVETVIRTVKKLQQDGKLEIRQHKIFLK
ncbi:MAG: Crp/Fnr family transcriptional regulator [Cyclobacteriaceae bacterium]|nr:Crp/Fnr family transcriptional regulator [Cyclobacteriaceae bacterium]